MTGKQATGPSPSTLRDEQEGLRHAIRRRVRAHRSRVFEATALAVIAWLALRTPLVGLWLAAVLASGLLETAIGRSALVAVDSWSHRHLVLATQVISATLYSGIAALVLLKPSAVGLGGACFILCAVSLANALKSSSSRPSTWALVTPPAAGLVLAPLWAGFVGGAGMTLSETLLMALGGVGYVAFIMRAARTIVAEREAVRRAAQDAESGRQRWRMVFHDSPMARICFDAADMYARLEENAHGRTRLGDVLLEQFPDRQSLVKVVKVIEANGEARALFARYGGMGAFGDDFLPAFAEALNGIDPFGTIPPFETTIETAAGEERVIRVHYRATAGTGMPWSLCLGTYDDVTEARRASQAHEEARVAAEHANRAKSDFLALMSHEIRTPLNGVLGMAQAMDLEPLEPRQRERVQVIRESGGALMDLLDDLLDISRIEAGRLTLQSEAFDLCALAESAHAAFAGQAAAKGLAYPLEIATSAEGLWRGDAGRIRQILSNLISNGIKFTEAGRVAVWVGASADGVRIEVTDTGIGIPQDRIGRLFERFVQADGSTTRANGGAGLGLAICQELSRAMDGAIAVASAPGVGSTFALDLPLERAEPPAEEERPAPLTGALAASDLRILAAEDNDVNRMVLKTLLGQLGIEPTLVENGAEAVRVWESAHWDMILMDVQMPVMDGPTATMTIRAREAVLGRPRTPILAVTANTMPHQVASYHAAGMDDVVAKPLNVRDLLAAVIAAAAQEEPLQETRIAS